MGIEMIRYVCIESTYNKLYGTVIVSKNDKYRDVKWETGVYPEKSRIKSNYYYLYKWI